MFQGEGMIFADVQKKFARALDAYQSSRVDEAKINVNRVVEYQLRRIEARITQVTNHCRPRS